MTSDGTFPQRLTKVDDLTRPDHWYLTADDACYFIGEYTAYRGYAHSDTNHLIFNFKKTMDRRGRPEWRYKDRAIQTAVAAFRRTLAPKDLDRLTFVPTPPSKAKGDPLYDDRLTRMLGAIRPKPPLDVRELVVQTVSTAAVHVRDVRPAPEQIQALLSDRRNIGGASPRHHRRGRRYPDDRGAFPGGEIGPVHPLSGNRDHRAVHRPAGAGYCRP